ncbi:hypothetical protein [Pasteurella multocida]|uniref:hypothetical protein n=1 Tax=Pasteurella multocida TaxID=747 RepID=UPI001897DB87|nr:hypothetical protein [Pasteurella multocida]MBF6985514.1 hypothetical protein [Pasteurella multocida]
MSWSISSNGMATALFIGEYFSCILINGMRTSLLRLLKMPLTLIAIPLVSLTARLLCCLGVW